MDALQLAGWLKNEIAVAANIPLPAAWAQLGNPIMTCTGVAVGVLAMTSVPLYPETPACEYVETATFQAMIARECAIEFDQEGNTVPASAEALAAAMERDRETLQVTVQDYLRGHRQGTSFTYEFAVEGALAAVSLTVDDVQYEMIT